MLYRTMKKTGDELSILGFGCMRLPQKRGQPGSGKIDEERAAKQLYYAIDQGVNYIDTAMPYHMGGSEPFLGHALSNGYREKVKLATKLPHWSVKVKEDMDHLLNAQLDKLQTGRIDYYLLHGLDGNSWNTIKNFEVREFLDKAKKDGRITNAGFSFHGDQNAFKKIVDAYDWEFCQIQYNFLDEQNQAGTEGLKYAAAKGLGLIIMEPLRGGNLAAKIPLEVEAIWNEAEVKRTPAEWALRWVWNRPEVTVVLSGMNEEAHIEENLRIASKAQPNTLTDKELQLVSRVTQTYRKLMKVGCTGCRYCMPCPAGVDIPVCFEHYNSYYMFDNKRLTKIVYLLHTGGTMGRKPGLASQCAQCGKCVKACPQHLPIPELLQDVKKDMQGLMTQPLIWILKRVFAIQNWNTLRKARRLERR